MTVDLDRILELARRYPALAITPERAAAIAADVAALERACDEALARFGPGDGSSFDAALVAGATRPAATPPPSAPQPPAGTPHPSDTPP